MAGLQSVDLFVVVTLRRRSQAGKKAVGSQADRDSDGDGEAANDGEDCEVRRAGGSGRKMRVRRIIKEARNGEQGCKEREVSLSLSLQFRTGTILYDDSNSNSTSAKSVSHSRSAARWDPNNEPHNSFIPSDYILLVYQSKKNLIAIRSAANQFADPHTFQLSRIH